nr:MAG TPA: hypothetical protein [Caudoviricetes sp.]
MVNNIITQIIATQYPIILLFPLKKNYDKILYTFLYKNKKDFFMRSQ